MQHEEKIESNIVHKTYRSYRIIYIDCKILDGIKLVHLFKSQLFNSQLFRFIDSIENLLIRHVIREPECCKRIMVRNKTWYGINICSIVSKSQFEGNMVMVSEKS